MVEDERSSLKRIPDSKAGDGNGEFDRLRFDTGLRTLARIIIIIVLFAARMRLLSLSRIAIISVRVCCSRRWQEHHEHGKQIQIVFGSSHINLRKVIGRKDLELKAGDRPPGGVTDTVIGMIGEWPNPIQIGGCAALAERGDGGSAELEVGA